MVNKKIVLLIVLSISLFFICADALMAEEAIKLERAAERTKFTEYKMSPFISKIKHAKMKSDVALSLNGILWDKITPSAIINNEVVNVGDVVEGNRVVAITPNRVILNNGAEDFELTLGR